MKAMKLTGIRQMEMMEVSDPEIKNAKDVLIKMTRIGVCGSDVHYYETGQIGYSSYIIPILGPDLVCPFNGLRSGADISCD